MCVRLVPRRPAALARVFSPDSSMMDMIRKWAPDEDGRYLAATDGGADGKCGETRVASWGAALKGVAGQASGYVPGMDQCSTAAETWALLQFIVALDAVARERQLSTWPCTVLIDNRTVQRRLAQAHSAPNPPQAWRLWHQIHGIAARLEVQSRWVPSHGKREDWQPPLNEGDAADWRALNKSADEAAGAALARRVRSQKEWRYERDIAHLWSQKAVTLQRRMLDRLRARFPQD